MCWYVIKHLRFLIILIHYKLQIRFIFSEDLKFTVGGRSRIPGLSWSLEFDLYLETLALAQEESPESIKKLLDEWNEKVLSAHQKYMDPHHGKQANDHLQSTEPTDFEDLTPALTEVKIQIAACRALIRDQLAKDKATPSGDTHRFCSETPTPPPQTPTPISPAAPTSDLDREDVVDEFPSRVAQSTQPAPVSMQFYSHPRLF